MHREFWLDEAEALTHQISGHRDAIADYKDQLSNTAIPSMPQERFQERIVEETTDVFVPQVMKEAVKLIPQDNLQNCTVEQIVAVPVPRIPEKTGEVIQLIQQESISDRVVEHIIASPCRADSRAQRRSGESHPSRTLATAHS